MEINDTQKLIQAAEEAFNEYIKTENCPKLQIGCGPTRLDGWFNTDLRTNTGIYYLDLLKKFNFPDNSFNFIFSEHNIEHFSIQEAAHIILECHRVLKPGGVFRISTPDLRQLVDFYLEDNGLHDSYCKFQTDKCLPLLKNIGVYKKSFVLNNFFRDWGHQTIFDYESLAEILSLCGFKDINRIKLKESSFGELRGIEKHDQYGFSEKFNKLETMTIEAAKGVKANPLVSVILPTYNAEKYLKEAIDSILNQTYQKFELIIVDDNSKDKTLDIINDYSDERIRVIQGPRKGISAALNLGLDVAQGEYIARMDADDISLPQRFEKQVEFMDNNPEIGLCSVFSKFIGTSDDEYTSWCANSTPEKIRTRFLWGTAVCHPTVMFRSELFKKYNLRYDETFKVSEDMDIWSRAMEVMDFGMVDEPLFLYRWGEDNGTLFEEKEHKAFYSVLERTYKKLFDLDIDYKTLLSLSLTAEPKDFKFDDIVDSLKIYEKVMGKIKESPKYDFEMLHWYYTRCISRLVNLSLNNDEKFEFIKIKTEHLDFSGQIPCIKDTTCKYKVSVVIPTYNSEKYIKDSIESILKQTFKDFEIIIVDDNSTDETLKIIKRFRDKRIKVIQGPEEGLATALNVGIDAAQGEYIARMDSDDIALTDRLEKQLGYMDTNPDIGICGSGAVFWNQEADKRDFNQNPFEDIDIRTSLFFVCSIIHPTVMFRKSVLDEHNLRYAPECKSCEDLELWLRAARLVKFHNMPEPLIAYRVHSSNVSITDGKNLKKFSHKLYQANYKEIFDIEIADDIIGAFRPTERLDTSYSLDQVMRIVKTSEDLIKKIKELENKDQYNIPFFEKTLLEGVQQIIQNNSANFAQAAK